MDLSGGLNSFDAGLISFLNQFARQSRILDVFIETVANADILKGAAIMAPFLWIWFREGENRTRDREFVILSLFVSTAAVLLARALALSLPFRERPLRASALHFQIPYMMNPRSLEGWSSFPSDHATIFFAAATCLFFISRRLGIFALLYSFFVICLPRIYLGIHYPTDIIGGVLVGSAMAFWVKVGPLRTLVARPFLRWEQLYPSQFYPLFFIVTFEVSELFASLRLMGHFGFMLTKAVAARLLH